MTSKVDIKVTEERRKERILQQRAERAFQIWKPRLPIQAKQGLTVQDHRLCHSPVYRLTFDDVSRAYKAVTAKLELQHERIRTSAEVKFQSMLQKVTRLVPMTNTWIGPFNFDFFFPQIGRKSVEGVHSSTQGLVVEIDGGIHNREPKMRKDLYRLEALSQKGIYLYSCPNLDLNEQTVRDFLRHIRSLTISDSRTKQRLLTNIYLWTIFAHATEEEIEQFFEAPIGVTKAFIDLLAYKKIGAKV